MGVWGGEEFRVCEWVCRSVICISLERLLCVRVWGFHH